MICAEVIIVKMNEQTCELLIPLGVSEHCLVCRPRCKDTTRVVGIISYNIIYLGGKRGARRVGAA